MADEFWQDKELLSTERDADPSTAISDFHWVFTYWQCSTLVTEGLLNRIWSGLHKHNRIGFFVNLTSKAIWWITLHYNLSVEQQRWEPMRHRKQRFYVSKVMIQGQTHPLYINGFKTQLLCHWSKCCGRSPPVFSQRLLWSFCWLYTGRLVEKVRGNSRGSLTDVCPHT